MRTVRGGALPLALVLAMAAAGCGGSQVRRSQESPAASPTPTRTDAPTNLQDVAMPRPGPFDPPLESADILLSSQDPLPDSVVQAVEALPGVTATVQFSLASFYVEEEQVVYAAVDPATFRRFAFNTTATTQEVWDRVADGEIAIRPDLEKTLPIQDGTITLGNDQDAPKAHIGALGELVDRSRIGAVLNERWASKLRMPQGNAMLVSTGVNDPEAIRERIAALAGNRAAVQQLALSFDSKVNIALVTGGSVARAVGSFTYTANADGTVNPDPAWVRAYIRSEQVPILGTVRCNKAMLPQLRAALTDVVRQGLASKIRKSQYGGCYVPRFIARDPSKGLSFHTFGTAVDLNVPENQRGTVGLMDRQVVEIFEKWGFNWGGTWRYTDPMHFELARIVEVR